MSDKEPPSSSQQSSRHEDNDPQKLSAHPSKHDAFFNTDHLKEDIQSRSVRGGLVTALAQITKILMGLTSTFFLARLVTPEDYGLIAMVVAITGFMNLFKDLGLSMATIQRKDVTHQQVSTLFWINVLLGGLLALLTAALSPVLAWFNSEPALFHITLALSSGFLFSSLTVQHQAILNRQMRFRALAVIQILSGLGASLSALTVAYLGFGYWALVIQNVGYAILSFIATWVACSWRPNLPRNTRGLRAMLAFGGNITGFNVVNYFARNLDDVLIGKFWGKTELGLYTKAYELFLQPLRQINGPITSVTLPALSRLQDEPDKYRAFYLNALAFVTYLTTPVVAFLIIFSEEVILLALGDQWAAAVPIFRALALCGLIQPIMSTAGWLYISTGQSARMLRWGFAASAAIVAAFLIGMPFGILAVSYSYSACMYVLLLPCMWYATQPTSVSTGSVFKTIAPNFASTALAVLPALAVKFGLVLQPLSDLPRVLFGALSLVVLYWFISFYLFRMKAKYTSFLHAMRARKKKT